MSIMYEFNDLLAILCINKILITICPETLILLIFIMLSI